MEFLYGAISGIVGTISTYPLDTLKVRKQVGSSLHISHLYKGIKYPIAINAMYKGGVFLINDRLNIENTVLKGAATGGIMSLLSTPLEHLKCQAQSYKPLDKNIMSLYRGFPPTFVRDTIHTGIYFKVYETLKPEYGSLIAGGTAGTLGWAFTYPIDVVKTCIQTGEKIAYTPRNLFRGIHYSLLRAFPTHAIIFTVYETLKKIG